MLPSNLELLNHIIDEISFIKHSVINKNRDEVSDDPVLSRAIIRGMEIISEACTKVDPDFKLQYPHIERRKMSDTRNRLIHAYFGVDYDIVWNIITDKLPNLNFDVKKIIEENTEA